MNRFKRFAILIFLILIAVCMVVGFSACFLFERNDDIVSDEDKYGANMTLRFASESSCPNGNIDENALKDDMVFQQNENYYAVIDFSAKEDENSFFSYQYIYTQISVYPYPCISATIEEAHSSMFTEDIGGDTKIIKIRFKTPQKKGEEKKERVIIKFSCSDTQDAYFSAAYFLGDGMREFLGGRTLAFSDSYTKGLEIEPLEAYSSYIGAKVVSIGTAQEKDIVIPAYAYGLPVTDIKQYAFKNENSLTSVTLPKTVIRIGDEAFYGCRRITEIVIPDKVEYLGNMSTFENCTRLRSVTLSSKLRLLGVDTFKGCTSLKDIHFDGTMQEWHSKYMGRTTDESRWWYNEYDDNTGEYVVHCNDGDVKKADIIPREEVIDY